MAGGVFEYVICEITGFRVGTMLELYSAAVWHEGGSDTKLNYTPYLNSKDCLIHLKLNRLSSNNII